MTGFGDGSGSKDFEAHATNKGPMTGEAVGNQRNGTRGKTVLTEDGPLRIEVPRDRDATSSTTQRLTIALAATASSWQSHCTSQRMSHRCSTVRSAVVTGAQSFPRMPAVHVRSVTAAP